MGDPARTSSTPPAPATGTRDRALLAEVHAAARRTLDLLDDVVDPATPDTALAWAAAHPEALAPHAGGVVAIEPARGIVAAGTTHAAVIAAVRARPELDPDTVTLLDVPPRDPQP